MKIDITTHIAEYPDFPQKGILFRDINPIFRDKAKSEEILDFLEETYRPQNLDGVVGIESRGFYFGFALALRLEVPFHPLRKAGKLPGECVGQAYDLEYGQAVLEIQKDVLKSGQKILIHDDLLATGGTADAAAHLLKKQNVEIAGFSFLIELSELQGRKKLNAHKANILPLATY